MSEPFITAGIRQAAAGSPIAEMVMQHRLDRAEASVRKVREWLNLMADRGPDSLLLARELCLLLGWDAPRPGSPMCARCGEIGPVHAVHY